MTDLCMINYSGVPPTPATVPSGKGISGETDPLVAVVSYQAWGWPVTPRGHQVWLTLHPDTVALAIPVLLAAQVTGILTQRGCRPPTLIHPETPERWVLLAGQRSEGTLPWPTWVHLATGTLPLPPTMTAHGPLTWVHLPQADTLRRRREFEVFAALRTALRDPPIYQREPSPPRERRSGASTLPTPLYYDHLRNRGTHAGLSDRDPSPQVASCPGER